MYFVFGNFGAVTWKEADFAFRSLLNPLCDGPLLPDWWWGKRCIQLLVLCSRIESVTSMVRILFWFLLSIHLISGAGFFWFHVWPFEDLCKQSVEWRWQRSCFSLTTLSSNQLRIPCPPGSGYLDWWVLCLCLCLIHGWNFIIEAISFLSDCLYVYN